MARQFYYIKIELTVKLNDMEKVNKTWFVHCNMNQKYVFFFLKVLISDGLSMLISYAVFTF